MHHLFFSEEAIQSCLNSIKLECAANLMNTLGAETLDSTTPMSSESESMQTLDFVAVGFLWSISHLCASRQKQKRCLIPSHFILEPIGLNNKRKPHHDGKAKCDCEVPCITNPGHEFRNDQWEEADTDNNRPGPFDQSVLLDQPIVVQSRILTTSQWVPSIA